MIILNVNKINLLIILVFPIFGILSQSIDCEIVVTSSKKDASVEPFENEETLIINFDYASQKINTKINNFHNIDVVTRVENFYTICKHQGSFNQDLLNFNRIKNLKKENEIFKNPLINWINNPNEKCSNREEGIKYFHGFIVYFRPKPSIELTKKEIDKIKISLSERTKVEDIESEESNPCDKNQKILKDDVVKKVFDRNKEWSEMLIVADLTGSMYPYTNQLIFWFKLNTLKNKLKSYLFFNDGDMNPDKGKRPMMTKGLYYSEVSKFEDIRSLAEKTMKAGYGGDSQENDIEALVSGIEHCPSCKDIILIADNFSRMRDLEYFDSIKKPVKIIICGFYGIINPEYIYLAWKTGGSIHTIEEDILHLSKLNEGESIKIGDKYYLLKNNKFVLMNDI
ncbi:hypothetical protein [Leptospira sp. GIMC2001]|uniref:hypothetical protein n=1 Tax=Leptospira sp. GIMC2001 TaxID=1513297 RepID=UPI00234A2D8A|nr:hypothetical protein [Leptospira sp. GIMC2001]WCL50652.1 hypothetical protein O4O04_07525 [Leptospira sp. GIMC2001]